MILYHGSNVTVDHPKLVPQNRYLDFVSENRQGIYHGKQHDLIYGAVANDDVYRTITLYMTHVLDKEQTLHALKIR